MSKGSHTNRDSSLRNAEQWPCAPDFLKLLWFTRWYVCVCVSTPEGINNQWRDMV